MAETNGVEVQGWPGFSLRAANRLQAAGEKAGSCGRWLGVFGWVAGFALMLGGFAAAASSGTALPFFKWAGIGVVCIAAGIGVGAAGRVTEAMCDTVAGMARMQAEAAAKGR